MPGRPPEPSGPAGRGPGARAAWRRWGSRRWRVPAVLLGAAAVLMVSAWAARGAAPTIGFALHLDHVENHAVRELLHRFETETGIRAQMVELSSDESLVGRLAADRRNGARIAVFAEDNVKLLPLLERHLVEDLSGLLVHDVDIQLVPHEGKGYFLPFRPNVQVVYVTREAMKATGTTPPMSREDFLNVARAFRKQAGEGKVTLSLAPGDPGAVTVAELILSFGGDPTDLGDAGSVAAFSFLQDLWKQGVLAPESLKARFDNQAGFLDDGTSWLAQTWPFTSTVLAGARKLDDFVVTPGWSPTHVVGGDVLGIPRGLPDRERKAARALVEFLIGRDSQRFLAKENAWPSIREDAYAGIWWGGCGGSRCPPWVAAHQIEHAETLEASREALRQGEWLRPITPRWQQVTCAMTTAVSRILPGGEDTPTVLAELHGSVVQGTACHQGP